jgi:hypothetical protein
MTRRIFPGDEREYIISQIDQKHYDAKCNAVLLNSDRVECYWSYHQRVDHLIKAFAAHKLHQCHPGKPVHMTLDNFFKNPVSQISDESRFSEDVIMKKLVLFGGRKNISIPTLASDELYHLMTYCFAAGARHGDRTKPLDSANAFIHHYQRDKLSDIFIHTADELHRATMKFFSGEAIGYCSCSLDEGSTQSRKLLDFC